MKIKIIAVPAGEAPEKVRRAWVGLEIPLPAGKQSLVVGESSGTASGKKTAFRGYFVDTETAVSLLAERAPTAAAWWRQNAAPLFQPGRGLGFREEFCETIDDGVTGAAHCVLVTFPFEGTDLAPIFALEDALSAAIEASRSGEFDGNEAGGGEVVLYMYGPDADALFAAITPVLADSALAAQGVVTRRYGPPADGVREVETPIRAGR
jgi:hypothetical protein